jgi:antitoxin (DNA-binding transcriptional repressor) of toxin-antitoxin stability system
MKTLTITKARANLSSWMSKALAGEDIGIIHPSGEILALRRVEVYSGDYAFQEYGLNETQLAQIAEKLAAKDAVALKSGKPKPWKA